MRANPFQLAGLGIARNIVAIGEIHRAVITNSPEIPRYIRSYSLKGWESGSPGDWQAVRSRRIESIHAPAILGVSSGRQNCKNHKQNMVRLHLYIFLAEKRDNALLTLF